jgi:3-phytase
LPFFSRSIPNQYLGSFEIVDSLSIDGAQETDGIDVVNANLGEDFPEGLFVVQDGFNYDGDSLMTQNFKYISWKEIVTSLNLD